MRYFLLLLFCCLSFSVHAQSMGEATIDEDRVEWIGSSDFGTSTLVQTGDSQSTQLEFVHDTPHTNPIEISVNVANDNWRISDGIDTISFTRTQSGYSLIREKIGYSETHVASFDLQGNYLHEHNGLGVGLSNEFRIALENLERHYLEIPVMAESRSAVGRDMSCGWSLTLGGLAIVGESIGYGLTWFTGPVGGIAATPVYILAVHATNRWALSNCRL